MERRFITTEEAISLLRNGDTIHTFQNPGGMLLGADWNRDQILEAINQPDAKPEMAGDLARRMDHGLVIMHSGSQLWIETDSTKLNAFDVIEETVSNTES